MQKHIVLIILFLLCLLSSSPVEARLTLGVVVGSNDAAGEITSAQANSLAGVLAQKLNEEVVVRELSDPATLLNWLDRFAMLDLALFPVDNIEATLGGFVQVGPVGEQGQFNLVFRQGVAADLPQRIGKVVRESGFEPWRTVKVIELPDEPVKEKVSLPLEEPVPDESELQVAEQVDLQDVAPPVSDRAFPQQEGRAYVTVPSYEEDAVKSLVLSVFPEPDGLVQTAPQTEELLRYLEQTIPVSIKIKEFADAQSFNEWFLRYRMVDLAIVSPAAARANLGNDYTPVAKVVYLNSQGEETKALVVMRHGQNEEMRGPLQRAFLDMMQTVDGQALFAALNLKEVLAPEDITGRKVVFEYQPGPVVEVKEPVAKLPVKPVEKVVPPVVEYPEPAKPEVPVQLAAAKLPSLPQINEPDVNLSVVEMVDVSQPLPESEKSPKKPVPPEPIPEIVSPEASVQKSAPSEPENIQQVEIVPPVVPPGLSGAVEPPVELVMPEQPAAELPVPEAAVLPSESEPPVATGIVDVPDLPAQPSPPSQKDDSPAVESGVPEESTDLVDSDESVPSKPAIEVAEIAPPVSSEQPLVDASPELEQSEIIDLDANVVSEEQAPQPIASFEEEIETETLTSEDPVGYEQQAIIEESEVIEEKASPRGLSETETVVSEGTAEAWSEEEFAAVLGDDMVAAVVAQPDLPPEFRPSGVPVVRPGRVTRPSTVSEDQVLVASLPEPLKKVEPPRPPKLLPDEEPEPGIVYIVPFAGVMVPEEVHTRVFDQFVDQLTQESEALDLQFVILKGGLQRVTPEWLAVRKYVTGEIYAYVEDSSCCSTDLRTKARLTYRHPNQKTAAFDFEYPVRRFFEHDRSTIDVARTEISDDIAETLSGELLKALQN